MAITVPFVSIDAITAKNARKNLQIIAQELQKELHLQSPLRAPSVVNTEKGPTWRNLVIPKAPVTIDIA